MLLRVDDARARLRNTLTHVFIFAAILASVLVSTIPVAADHGGPHGQAPMVIQIRHADEVNLNPTISEPSLHPSNQLSGSITVQVGGVICGETTLPPIENRGDLAGQVVATILPWTAARGSRARRRRGSTGGRRWRRRTCRSFPDRP